MSKEEESLKNMISSPDRENAYLAACILRGNTLNFTVTKKKQLLGKIPLEDRIKNYADICQEVGHKELTIEDFSSVPEEVRRKTWARAMLEQIALAVNGKWKADWSDYNQDKWYPYFEKKGRGLVFLCSHVHLHGYLGLVAFKDQATSDFVGKNFMWVYEILHE